MNKQQLIEAIRTKQSEPLAESTLRRKSIAELKELLAQLTGTEDEPRGKEPKFDLASTKQKIAKLLSKAERTDNEHERDAFNKAAEKLMLRLGVERAELEAAGNVEAEEIIEVSRQYKSVYAKNMVRFGSSICTGIGNLTTLHSGRWSEAKLYIIGHRSDVELAERLLDSLELQVMTALTKWQKTTDRTGYSKYDKLVGNRSFISGFAQTARQRVEDAHRVVAEEEHVSSGAALVLASRQDRINDWVNRAYPKLGKDRSGGGAFSGAAALAGEMAGESADVGAKRFGGKLKELA